MEAERVKVLLQEADAHYKQGDLDAALKAYREVLAEDDKVAWAYSRIGAILAQFGDQEAAEESLHKAIELDPTLPQAHSNLGNIYYARGDYERALEKYQEAVRLDPHQPVYYENLHAANKQLGRIGDAVAALKKAQRLYQENAREEARSRLREARANLGGRGCLGTAALVLLPVILLIAALI